jgi:hypothetical protein
MKFGMILPFLKRGSVGENILLTGIPRSGTTLACRLLCDFSQTIALNEPMDQRQFSNPHLAKINIIKHFKTFRKSLLTTGTAVARTKGGVITDNAYTPDSLNRERVVERTSISFNKPLNSDFTLIMKHCAEFSLLLPELRTTQNIYAIIRNPLALLGSWASVNVPVSRGKVAKSAQLNPELNAALENMGDKLLERQLFILSWYFGQFQDISTDHIIRYEDLVKTPIKYLSPLAGGEFNSPISTLQNKNTNASYNKKYLKLISEVLLNSEGNYWKYYTKDNVKELLQKMTFYEQ